jgi:hypothetical protein
VKIGYGKLGRSMPLTLDKCGNLGGDVECVAVVKELALRHQEDTFYLLGRNSGEDPQEVGLPPNVINMWPTWQPMLRAFMTANHIKGNMTINQHKLLWKFYESLTQPVFEEMNGHVWWVGQHGSSNSPIPMTNGSDQLTKPHDSYSFYCAFVFQGLNAWRDKDPFTREEVYLNADARNRHKMRDLKWPLKNPVLTQYSFTNNITHERYGDLTHPTHADWPGVGFIENPYRWSSLARNIYARLEINGLAPGTPFGDLISFNDTWENRGAFGMFINEARAQGIGDDKKRVNIMKKWVLPLYTTACAPFFIHGTWSDASQEALRLDIDPAPWNQYYPKLHSVRATFTTPSSGSGWATAKPWEAFAGGTVCFFHPDYDDQDNILGDVPILRQWLRVKTPFHLESNIRAVNEDRELWLSIVHAQRAHFNRAMKEKRYLRLIEERIWG